MRCIQRRIYILARSKELLNQVCGTGAHHIPWCTLALKQSAEDGRFSNERGWSSTPNSARCALPLPPATSGRCFRARTSLHRKTVVQKREYTHVYKIVVRLLGIARKILPVSTAVFGCWCSHAVASHLCGLLLRCASTSSDCDVLHMRVTQKCIMAATCLGIQS